MNQSDEVTHKIEAFNNNKYLDLQRNAIFERINHFKNGRLYLEIGGKFLFDSHAQRVLPGFKSTNKKQIFDEIKHLYQILFCVNWDDINTDRQLKNTDESYTKIVFDMINRIEKEISLKPILVINMSRLEQSNQIDKFILECNNRKLSVYKRFYITGYPKTINKILGPDGFEKDQYIPLIKPLILVTGAASRSGKLSTCLGQMYHDAKNGIESGYSKYELFPIWNLALKHPVNLAYEAATVDIGDFNTNDKFHKKYYGTPAVNYNRDEEAFLILKNIAEKFTSKQNFVRQYKSPTDMGINYAGYCITNDFEVCNSALEEIKRRKVWYQEIVDRGDGKKNWVIKCRKLEIEAIEYITEHYK